MIDNIAKVSNKSKGYSQQPRQTSNSNGVNTSAASPIREHNRNPVLPNAPKIERRRHIPASQYSTARRNIFIFLVNEERSH